MEYDYESSKVDISTIKDEAQAWKMYNDCDRHAERFKRETLWNIYCKFRDAFPVIDQNAE